MAAASSSALKHVGKAFKELNASYELFVARNAEQVDRVEQILRSLILVMPAKLGIKSEANAQAVYATVNLVSLYNRLLALKYRTSSSGSAPLPADLMPKAVPTLAWASVAEHTSLALELFAGKILRDDKAKWAIIALVEVARTALQLNLIRLSNGKMVTRHNLSQIPPLSQDSVPITYEESRWRGSSALSVVPKRGNAIEITAEVLHAVRPLLDLGLAMKFGTTSWKTWLISILSQVLSRAMHSSRWNHLSEDERAELNRRSLLWAIYILRSPFYEAMMDNRAFTAISTVAQKIPLLSSVISFIGRFLSLYRKHHFNLSLI